MMSFRTAIACSNVDPHHVIHQTPAGELRLAARIRPELRRREWGAEHDLNVSAPVPFAQAMFEVQIDLIY